MNVRRFFAPTARDALRLVKEDMGGEAIVLSNRSVEGGVEILAVPPQALSSLQTTVPPRSPARAESIRSAAAPSEPDDADFKVSLSHSMRTHSAARAWRPFEPRKITSPAAASQDLPRQPKAAPARAPATVPPETMPAMAQPIAMAGSAIPDELRQELASIKTLLERQLAAFAWGEMARATPAKSALLGELLESGFSGELAQRLVDELPAELDQDALRNALRTALSRDLMTLNSDADIIDRGGVYALVGPTGVGKTTTTAKLAARCVVRHGADRLALLTTDGYRIGAHEQLRIYGRILGVSVHAVRDAADLRQTLAELKNKHMVLIDTVGMSQRDRAVAEQAAMLVNAGNVKRLLLLNATCRGDTLDDVVRAYAGADLAGAIVTKVDEAATLASAIDVLVRNELQLFYVANGQRVPEDLHLPNRPYLFHRALRGLPENSPHQLAADQVGVLLAAQASAAARVTGAYLG